VDTFAGFGLETAEDGAVPDERLHGCDDSMLGKRTGSKAFVHRIEKAAVQSKAQSDLNLVINE